MNLLQQYVIRAYSGTLSLYPRRFKDEFADEMQTVFRNSVADAAGAGMLPWLFVCSREFMGMPFNILKEFWHEIQGEELNMENTSFAPLKPGSWGDSFWAGLPHLLIAILFATTSTLANTGLGTVSGVVLGLMMLAGFLATVYYTWRNHWPAWSASWYGYLGLIILLYSTLPYQDWVGLADRVFAVIQFVILFLCTVTVLYWISRRNPIEGLLMAMPVVILYWFPVMEFIPNSIRFWLTFWLFLLPALTATAITRLNDINKAVWLVLGTSLLIGLPIAYARTYWNNIPVEYSSLPSIGQMAEQFTVPWLASAALVLGPILGWGLWRLGSKQGNVGRGSAILVIIGMAVNLLGHYSYWWSFSGEAYLNALKISAVYQPDKVSSTFMVYAGLVAILLGSIGLAVLTWQKNKFLSISLILVPLVLPVVARFTTYFGYYVNVAGTSLELARLSGALQYLILFVGAVWLAVSGWSIPRLYDPSANEGAA